MRSSFASLVVLSLFALAAMGSASKGNKSDGNESPSASAALTSGDSTEPKVSVSGKTVPNYEYIRATCDNRASGECDEFYGLIPKFTPEDCPKNGGIFTTSFPTPHACPKENLIGTCHYIQSEAGEPGEYVNYYANGPMPAAIARHDCLEQTGSKKEWIDAPAIPAASASHTAAKAPAKPAAKPAAHPSAPAAHK
jgi:hypothetical protein